NDIKWCEQLFGSGAIKGETQNGLKFIFRPHHPKAHNRPGKLLNLFIRKESGLTPRAILVYFGSNKSDPQVQGVPGQTLKLAHNIEAQVKTWSKAHGVIHRPLAETRCLIDSTQNSSSKVVLQPNVARHTYWETQHYASASVMDTLTSINNFSLCAI